MFKSSDGKQFATIDLTFIGYDEDVSLHWKELISLK